MADRPIPNTNAIQMYLHCRRCLAERPADTSPADWARLNVGFTDLGMQVWCERHDCNVVHVDYEGMRHPANTKAAVAGEEDADDTRH